MTCSQSPAEKISTPTSPDQTKHTPLDLPWRIGPYCRNDIVSDHGTIGSTRGTPEGFAKAAFIVQAVNSHEELVEALKACLPFVKSLRADAKPIPDAGKCKCCYCAVIAKAEAALKKAGVKL